MKYKTILQSISQDNEDEVFELYVEVNGNSYKRSKYIRNEERKYSLVRNTEEFIIGSLFTEIGEVLKGKNQALRLGNKV